MSEYTINDYYLAGGDHNTFRDLSGRLWTVHVESSVVYIAYSDDDGETWTTEQVYEAPGDADWRCGIAVDSAGNAHVVWANTGEGENSDLARVQYRKRATNGTWGDVETIYEVTSSSEDSCPSIVVDSDDDPHVAFCRGGNLYYASRGASEWTVEEVPNGDAGELALAVDGENLYILTTYNTYVYLFTRDSGGSWSKETVRYKDGASYKVPRLIVVNGTIYCSWYDSSADEIQYRCKDGSWGDIEIVADSSLINSNGSLQLRQDGTVIAVYTKKGGAAWVYQIYKRERSGSGWGSESMVFESDEFVARPGAFYARYPQLNILKNGIAVAYQYDYWGSNFYKTDDLSWSDTLWIPGAVSYTHLTLPTKA